MKFRRLLQCLAIPMLGYATAGFAYESEEAVPLFIQGVLGSSTSEKISIELNGRLVSIDAILKNQSKGVNRIGVAAFTPFFNSLGEGEEHYEKSFSEIAIKINDKTIKPTIDKRGFFLGRDITAELKKANLPPLPTAEFNEKNLAKLPKQVGLKIIDWQGYVSYTWGMDLPALSNNRIQLSYRALPQFAIEEIVSANFSSKVAQHCGDPEDIRRLLSSTDNGISHALVERYVIPVHLSNMQEINLKVTQPSVNWLRARPALVLACGTTVIGNDKALLVNDIRNTDQPISILVISRLANPGK